MKKASKNRGEKNVATQDTIDDYKRAWKRERADKYYWKARCDDLVAREDAPHKEFQAYVDMVKYIEF